MLPEIRYVIFDEKNLKECLSLHVFRSNCNVQHKIENIHKIDLTNDKKIIVKTVCDEYLNTKIIEIDDKSLLKILVEYCIYKSIPLPINSNKSAKITSFGVCLIISSGVPIANIRKLQNLITPCI